MIPLFIVISAPSGAGKTTLCDLLLQNYPEICYSVSCTTRKPRLNEEDGVDYHFLTVEAFKKLIAENQFLEYAQVHDNYYGTLKAPIYEVLRDHVESLPPEDPMRRGFIDIFINPPDLEELRQRLENRATDSQEVIEKRIRNAEQEMARSGEYMYQVVNDDLDVAYRRICDIINVRAGLI